MQKLHKPLLRIIVISSVLGLFGCSAKTGCSGDSTKCFGSSPSAFKKSSSTPNLNPQFNYIRVTMNGQIVWLAQGATDQWPQQNTQVYYSSDRSVFKWANGRLISVTTPEYSWREHIQSPINWSSPKPITFSREIDTVYGMTALLEERQINVSSQPDNENYIGDQANLIWVHENTISKSEALQDKPSFDSWYAFESQNLNEPVYGQQCISKNYCLSWQVWKTS